MKEINKVNEFMLQKKESIIIDPSAYASASDRVNPNIVFGALANLETWAYTVDPQVVQEFLKLSEKDFLEKYYNPIVDTIKHMKGDDVSHDRFVFQNFPDSCREIPLEKLSAMRFARYYTAAIDEALGTDITSSIMDGKRPEAIKRDPLPAKDLAVIKLATMDQFYTLNRNLIGSRAALSELDKQIVDFSIRSNEIPKDKIIPSEIPYKETLALMLKYDMEMGLGLNIDFASYKDFKRALAVLSDIDPASKTPHLRKFTKKEKLYFLEKLEAATKKNPDIVEAQVKSDNTFARNLGIYWKTDKLPNYMKAKIPNVIALFHRAFNYDIGDTMETRKGEAIKNKDSIALLNELKYQPGELFRRLYFLLDNAKDLQETQKILETALKKAYEVPNDILMTTRAEILNSKTPATIKTAFPHGNTRNAIQFENRRRPLPDDVIKVVDQICINAVAQRLSKKLDFSDKKVYISEDMKKCPIPFATKDESSSTRTLAKGTRFKIDGLSDGKDLESELLGEDGNSEYLRFFVDKKIRMNAFVDLSISFVNDKYELVEQCSWTNLKTVDSGRPLAVHSGDGSDCINGLSEFIDVDLNVAEEYAKEKGIRYIAAQVLSYNHILFKDMDYCQTGIMKVDTMIKGKIQEEKRYALFDPKLVKDKIDLKGPEIVSIPFIYDIKNREVIICDVALRTENLQAAKKETAFKNSLRYSNNPNLGLYKTEHEKKLEEFAARWDLSYDAIKNYPTLESCQSIASNVMRGIVENTRPTLYDLYVAAAVAGGVKEENIVHRADDADISFSWDGVFTPYDRDDITSYFCTVENEFLTGEHDIKDYYDLFEKIENQGRTEQELEEAR